MTAGYSINCIAITSDLTVILSGNNDQIYTFNSIAGVYTKNTSFTTTLNSMLASDYHNFATTSDGELITTSQLTKVMIFRKTSVGYVWIMTFLASDYSVSNILLYGVFSNDGNYFTLGVMGVAYLYQRQSGNTYYSLVSSIDFGNFNYNFYAMGISQNGDYLFYNPHSSGQLYIYFQCSQYCDICNNTLTCQACFLGFTLQN